MFTKLCQMERMPTDYCMDQHDDLEESQRKKAISAEFRSKGMVYLSRKSTKSEKMKQKTEFKDKTLIESARLKKV